MRIPDSNSLGGLVPPATPAGGRSGPVSGPGNATESGGAGATPPPGTDRTSLGTSVATLTAGALGQPDLRASRVDSLRSQIAAGTYQPSLTAVAGSMLADPLSGLGTGGRG